MTIDASQAFAEQGVVFGQYENLVGVLRSATGSSSSTRSDTAVLILTPGMLHSAGPFRLHRNLSKDLAMSGIPSLRFDLSGIGESLAIGSTEDSLSRAATEISWAIDFLHEQLGVERVVCFGLCSGADDALFAAQRDHRIVGLYSLDGCGYRTPKFHLNKVLRHVLPKVVSVRKWRAKLSGLFAANRQPPSLQIGTDIREFPSQHAAEQQIEEMTARDIRMHFLYTGGVRDYYNYQDQFFDMFSELEWQTAALLFLRTRLGSCSFYDSASQRTREASCQLLH